jgi:hypothetical protein
MDPSAYPTIITNPAPTNATAPVPVGYDLLTPLLSWLFGGGLGELFNLDSLTGFFGSLWSFYAILAYIASALFVYLYIYASIHKAQLKAGQDQLIKDAERIYDEQFRGGPRNDRLHDVYEHIASENPNDWKLAIIEADIILDEALKRAGYVNGSLGERLRELSPAQLHSIEDAWQAHKVRNEIAHAGADFVLTKRIADDTIRRYRLTLEELGVT